MNDLTNYTVRRRSKDRIMYVGATAYTLDYRKRKAKELALRDASSPFQRWVRGLLYEGGELVYEESSFASEREAISHYGIDNLLNVREDGGPEILERRRRWTASEDALVGTMPDRELADQLGIHHSSVHERRLALCIEPHRNVTWTKRALGMLGEISDADVAKIQGCSSATATRMRHRLEIEAYDSTRAGRRGRGQFSDDTVYEIRRRYAGGDLTYDDLASDYDCSASTIGLLVRGKTYADVRMP